MPSYERMAAFAQGLVAGPRRHDRGRQPAVHHARRRHRAVARRISCKDELEVPERCSSSTAWCCGISTTSTSARSACLRRLCRSPSSRWCSAMIRASRARTDIDHQHEQNRPRHGITIITMATITATATTTHHDHGHGHGHSACKPSRSGHGPGIVRPEYRSKEHQPSGSSRIACTALKSTDDQMAKDAIVSDELAKKFATEKDTPYLRWVRNEGLDIINAHLRAEPAHGRAEALGAPRRQGRLHQPRRLAHLQRLLRLRDRAGQEARAAAQLFEEMIMILSGRGSTTVWNDTGRRSPSSGRPARCSRFRSTPGTSTSTVGQGARRASLP